MPPLLFQLLVGAKRIGEGAAFVSAFCRVFEQRRWRLLCSLLVVGQSKDEVPPFVFAVLVSSVDKGAPPVGLSYV